MRNLLLAIVAILASVQVNAQKMSMEFLEGTWIPETYASELTFSGTNDKTFKVLMITSDQDRESLEVLSYEFKDNNFYLESLYKPNNWKCIGRFIIIDKDTIVADYVSNASAVVIYKRKTK